MERENLAGDGKGTGTSGSNREVESTDERGLLRSSEEAGVMPGVAIGSGQPATEGTRCSMEGGSLRAWHEPDDARVSSPDL